MAWQLTPGQLRLSDIKTLRDHSIHLALDPACEASIQAASQTIHNIIQQKQTVYGINTGFGALASKRISDNDLESLQRRIVLSHAAGTGDYLSDDVVRLLLLLKINSLARGFSGVRMETIQALIALFNANLYPLIPEKGSVGASGDLAPLAHMSTILLGVGEVRHQGNIISAEDALAKIGLKPLTLAPKEGLALLNGTQASTALALTGLFKAEEVFVSALAAGALTTDAIKGTTTPFDARIHAIRGHQGQSQVAQWLEGLLKDSAIMASHKDCGKVQDPYSIRCQPQVMGACLTQLNYAAQVLLTEANAVSDNPLIFAEDGVILSGGNFHAEPVAFAADAIAIAIAEIGAISERRSALLVDKNFSGLPAFLVNDPGVNSGFMIAQVTAAALASENKSLAHPASVDSLPTSANQEDHVSMATFAARRLLTMADNTAGIIAIELLAACQGIDFLKPLTTSPILTKVHARIREVVEFYDQDRYFAPDIANCKAILQAGGFSELLSLRLFNCD